MLGIYLRHTCTLYVSSLGSLVRTAAGKNQFPLVTNVCSIQKSAKYNPLIYGLMTGCSFSKQNSEAEPIIPVSPAHGVNYNSGIFERLLNRTSQHVSVHSESSGGQGTVNICADVHTEDGRMCTLDGPENDDASKPDVSESAGAKTSVPVKRLSSETVDDCRAKQQKLDEVRKSADLLVDQSVPTAHVSEGKLPVVKDGKKSADDIPKYRPPAIRERQQRQRPNYFVSMKISNPEIHSSLEAVQAHISEQDSRLKPSFVSLDKLHITLMVLYLSDEEQHKRALEVLKNIHRNLNEDIGKHPLILEFNGLETFNGKVLFAKVKPGDSLDRFNAIAKDVIKNFQEASIFSTDKRDPNAHLTVLKLSKAPKLFYQGIKKINPALYASYKDYVFGSEEIKSIELLNMAGPEDEFGYYRGHHLFFGVGEESPLAASPSSLTDEIQNKKDKISQLAQQQLKRMMESSNANKASNSCTSHDAQAEKD